MTTHSGALKLGPTPADTASDPTLRHSRVADRLSGRHALVVGINYAPEHAGIAPYTTGLAEHLARRAASVSVLTGVPHYPQWLVEEYYRCGLRYRERGGTGHPDVVRLRHHVPARQSALTRASYEFTFFLNALTTPSACRPDLIVAVTPSLGGAAAGAWLARRHGAPLVVVVQDLMGKAAAQSGISGGAVVSGATARLEGWALRQATEVAVVAEAFRTTVTGHGVPEERIHHLPNWAHIASRSGLHGRSARAELGWPGDAFVVTHTGNMGLKQDLGNVVRAARLLGPDVLVLLIGDGSQRNQIEAQAAGVTNVRFVDPLDDDHYATALAAADLLLVNERPSVGDMSLPSKLTSYFAAGRPIVAAVVPDGATAAEIEASGSAGIVVPPGRPDVLAETINALKDDLPRRQAMARAARRYAETHLGRSQAMARFDQIVDLALAQRR
jgi:colanic acid biosynthesis glycosyl transferase WcaI